MRLSPEDRAALLVLIESLDGDGYLADPLARLLEIAERLARDAGPTVATPARDAAATRGMGTACAAR
jgi:DNA-directed RNA polymerase specialized sigma54-like protein